VIYFDAAYIAKCYLNEPGAEKVRALAAGEQGLASCELGRLEFCSTIRRHVREGNLTAREAREVMFDFEEDEHTGVWRWLPVTSELIRHACSSLQQVPRPVLLRAADALHLECARSGGFGEIYTNDRHILAAARHFALTARNVLTSP
jgi:predicted nucleic acid-binding protein